MRVRLGWLVLGGALCAVLVAAAVWALRPPLSAKDAAALSDFHAAQQAQLQALASGDNSALEGHWAGNALQDAEAAVAAGRVRMTVDEQSIEVLPAADPNDPTVKLEVHQVARVTKTAISSDGTELPLGTYQEDGRYWLRPLGPRLAITDKEVSDQVAGPGSPPWPLAVIGVAFLAAALLTGSLLARKSMGVVGAPSARPLPESPAETGPDLAALRSAAAAKLDIRLCGRLEVRSAGENLTASLNERPTASFVWQLLLLLELLGRRLSRADLADETYPGLDLGTRRRRLRNLLSSLRSELPEAVRAPLAIDRASAGFDLGDCRVDALEIIQAADRLSGRPVPAALLPEIDALLEGTKGEVLPAWETLVDQVTEGRGGAAELAGELRDRVAGARVELQVALADEALARASAQRAIELLTAALDTRPDREQIAQKLARAYRMAGREGDAQRLLRPYG